MATDAKRWEEIRSATTYRSRGIDVGAVRQEESHHVRMAVGRGPVERTCAVLYTALGIVRKELLNFSNHSAARTSFQRRTDETLCQRLNGPPYEHIVRVLSLQSRCRAQIFCDETLCQRARTRNPRESPSSIRKNANDSLCSAVRLLASFTSSLYGA